MWGRILRRGVTKRTFHVPFRESIDNTDAGQLQKAIAVWREMRHSLAVRSILSGVPYTKYTRCMCIRCKQYTDSTTLRHAGTNRDLMFIISDSDLKVSLVLADERYHAAQTEKMAKRRANRKAVLDQQRIAHAINEKALRCATKTDKEAGTIRRALEADGTRERQEREAMAEADEDSRVCMALMSEKLADVVTATDKHTRRFDDPDFHFVPRRKIMQIQSGCVETICQILNKNNRTNTWLHKDSCVVEQCLSALALYIHRQPGRCQQLTESKCGVKAIVTGLQECADNRFVQERGLRLVTDACLTFETCAEAFARAGILDAIAASMDRLVDDPRLQVCACDTMASVIAELPDEPDLLDTALHSGVHRAAARALRQYQYSERVLVAGLRALENIAGRCGPFAQACVQESLVSTAGKTTADHATGDDSPGIAYRHGGDWIYRGGNDGGGDSDGDTSTSCGNRGVLIALDRRSDGAAAFSLRIASAYSRDDSRTIVRRAGAVRVAISAFGLLRAVLTDAELCEEKEASSPSVVEFCRDQGVEVIIAAMEHHVHDATLLLAAWQAMHSAIRLAAKARDSGGGVGVFQAIFNRGKTLELAVGVAVRSMEVHLAVAPLQWICLVCMSGLHALEARVAEYFVIRNGCSILHRCIRANSRHTGVVEQGCRLVAEMSEPSFTSRTRFFVDKIQDAIHEAVFLHAKHRGVQALGTRALDALWGGDEFGMLQKEAAAARLRDARK